MAKVNRENTRTKMKEIILAHLTCTKLGTAGSHTHDTGGGSGGTHATEPMDTFRINAVDFYTLRKIFTFERFVSRSTPMCMCVFLSDLHIRGFGVGQAEDFGQECP